MNKRTILSGSIPNFFLDSILLRYLKNFRITEKKLERVEIWFEKYKMKLKTSKRHLMEKMIDEYSDGKLYNNFNEYTKKYLLTYRFQ